MFSELVSLESRIIGIWYYKIFLFVGNIENLAEIIRLYNLKICFSNYNRKHIGKGIFNNCLDAI